MRASRSSGRLGQLPRERRIEGVVERRGLGGGVQANWSVAQPWMPAGRSPA